MSQKSELHVLQACSSPSIGFISKFLLQSFFLCSVLTQKRSALLRGSQTCFVLGVKLGNSFSFFFPPPVNRADLLKPIKFIKCQTSLAITFTAEIVFLKLPRVFLPFYFALRVSIYNICNLCLKNFHFCIQIR